MNGIATIPAAEAHIWWTGDDGTEPRRLTVVRFAERKEPLGRFACDTGASEASWRRASPAERQRLLYQMAIEFMVAGHEPQHVIREFAKIREFAAAGGKSYPMCRALTEAIEGEASDDVEAYRERYLAPPRCRPVARAVTRHTPIVWCDVT